jgi:hypothetical protein
MKQAKIVILIIVIAIIAGLFIWRFTKQASAPSPIQQACTQEAKLCDDGSSVGRTGPNCEFAPCPEKVIQSELTSDTNDWQTYKNEKYGYQIQYPKNYVANLDNLQNISLNSPKNEQLKKDIANTTYFGEGYMEDINISYLDNIKDEPENVANKLSAATLQDFINKNPMITDKKEIDFAGEKAWSVTRGGFSLYYTIMVIHNGHFYQILFGNRDTESKLSDTEKKILSTFKFIK